LGKESLRWKRIASELETLRKKFGDGKLGARRSTLAEPPQPVDISQITVTEREPITVVLSEKGWIRAVRGHGIDASAQKFKEGDGLRWSLECWTTDRLCGIATDGRAFTLRAGDLPRGRGDGQPIRLMVELSNEEDLVSLFVLRDGDRHLVAASNGRGFVIQSGDLVAEKRTGKQILNLKPGERAAECVPVSGDHVAILGENRRLLVFPIDQVPVLGRGTGAMLQSYKDGGVKTIRVFSAADGLIWQEGAKARSLTDLKPHLGKRGEAGRAAPGWLPRQP
jgi:topoisomerase-4 subunit A